MSLNVSRTTREPFRLRVNRCSKVKWRHVKCSRIEILPDHQCLLFMTHMATVACVSLVSLTNDVVVTGL